MCYENEKALLSCLLLILAVAATLTFSVGAVQFDSLPEHEETFKFASEDSQQDTLSYEEGDLFLTAFRASPSSTTVQIYGNWQGNFITSAARFQKITFQNANLLNPGVYAVWDYSPGYRVYEYNPGQFASFPMGTIQVPVGVTTLSAISFSMQVYNMRTASWMSSVWPSNTITIR